MTDLFRRRQRAAEFAACVDGADGSRPLAQSTGGPPSEADRLVLVAQALRDHAGSVDAGAAAPREAFVTLLRERLVAEAAGVLGSEPPDTTTEPAASPRSRVRRERRLVAAATAAVVLGGSAGMATAAQGALPGEALYPVKRVVERLELEMSDGPAERGRNLLEQADERLDEVNGLLDRAPVGVAQVPGTLADFNAAARDGARLLMWSYRDSGDPQAVATVRRFAAAALVDVAAIADEAPAAAQPDLRDAARTLQDIDRGAADLCGICADLPTLELPSTLVAGSDAVAPRTDEHVVTVDGRPATAEAGPVSDRTPATGTPGDAEVVTEARTGPDRPSAGEPVARSGAGSGQSGSGGAGAVTDVVVPQPGPAAGPAPAPGPGPGPAPAPGPAPDHAPDAAPDPVVEPVTGPLTGPVEPPSGPQPSTPDPPSEPPSSADPSSADPATSPLPAVSGEADAQVSGDAGIEVSGRAGTVGDGSVGDRTILEDTGSTSDPSGDAAAAAPPEPDPVDAGLDAGASPAEGQ